MKSSLRRALFLSILLVILWIAIGLLPSTDVATGPPESTVTSEANQVEGASSAASFADGAALGSETALVRPGYVFIVLLLAGGGLLALWLKNKPTASGTPGVLREIGRLRTDQQQLLQLVACADEVLLVGTSASGVNLLKAYPASLFPSAAPPVNRREEPTQQIPPAESFSPSDDADLDPMLDNPDFEEPEWTVAAASAIGDGPDFLTVLRRYAGRKSNQANTLYPPNSANPNG